MEFHGVYGIPDMLKAKIDDPADAIYSYEFRATSGLHFKGGKIVPREHTEEEREQADQGKKGKAADAKKPAKGKVEEEPSAEEIEKLNREIADREKENLLKKADWDALDENTKFYRTCEDPFKEPRIAFMNGEGQED